MDEYKCDAACITVIIVFVGLPFLYCVICICGCCFLLAANTRNRERERLSRIVVIE